MPSNRELRTTFDRAAASYQAARPDYPDQLYADLLELTGLAPPARLLEVGCGPGKATLPLARMGFRITAVELGADLAAEARRNLAAFPEVHVHTAPFERWEPEPADFDLVFAATAWAWLDPDVKYAKAARLLRPEGYLATWNATHAFPPDADPFFFEIQEIYDEIGEGHPGEWPPDPPEKQPDFADEFEASGHFEAVGVRRQLWALEYDAEAYIALLNTFSGHIAMDAWKRDRLYAEIRWRLAERPDGRLTRHWGTALTVGRRIR